MQQVSQAVKEKALSLLQEGTVTRVLGWKRGLFPDDVTPAVFTSPEIVAADFVYDDYCGANLSKYLIAESRKSESEGKIAVFLKPCDSYSAMQLLKEHRILQDTVVFIGVQCDGMMTDASGKAEPLGKCTVCKSKKIVLCDTLIGVQGEDLPSARFEAVEAIEAMPEEERFAFWQGELSRCIRCNACRNVCPACSCEKCVFDNPASGAQNKAAASSFEEQMFHIIRAFHVAGRCTDCGECSRVCPQHIPLHLLNRKLIKDANDLYGTYQAGSDMDTKPPMLDYRQGDCEPSIVYQRGGKP